MRPFDFDGMDKSEKLETKDIMCERRLLLKVERHFIPAEESSSNQRFLAEKALESTPQKKLAK